MHRKRKASTHALPSGTLGPLKRCWICTLPSTKNKRFRETGVLMHPPKVNKAQGIYVNVFHACHSCANQYGPILPRVQALMSPPSGDTRLLGSIHVADRVPHTKEENLMFLHAHQQNTRLALQRDSPHEGVQTYKNFECPVNSWHPTSHWGADLGYLQTPPARINTKQ